MSRDNSTTVQPVTMGELMAALMRPIIEEKVHYRMPPVAIAWIMRRFTKRL